MADGEDERKLGRELNELLQELRVALPGVQVLFAFLLTIPFAQRFTLITDAQRPPISSRSSRPAPPQLC
jgi:Family of unknown function (DUF6328)